MLKISCLIVTGALIGAFTAPAEAAVYTSTFSGTATTSINATSPAGSTVTGSFTYDSSTSQFTSFKVGSYSAVAPFTSSVTVAPGGGTPPFSAFYTASNSVVQGTGTVNQTFALDLEALITSSTTTPFTSFPSTNPLTILTLPNLNSLLDPSSQFTYYTGTGSGTGVTNLVVSLSSISTAATGVPEPASMALLAVPAIAMVLRRRR